MAPPRGRAEAVRSQNSLDEPSDARSPPRSETHLYRLPQVARVLVFATLGVLALDSKGLLTWAERLEVSPAQTALVEALSREHALSSAIGLSRPRSLTLAAGEAVARSLGAQADPLLASGWRSAAAREARAAEPEHLIAAQVGEAEHLAPAPVHTADVLPSGPVAEPATAGDRTSSAVLLLGDSMMAGSLGSAIARSLDREPKPHLVRAVQTATGLSRPDVFDWMKVLPPLLEREKPQLIICSLGANDASDIWQGGAVLEFGHSGWRQAYAERVKTVMQTLTATGARVLWLGLPPMRSSSFSERARYLNKIFSQAASDVPRVEYFDVETLISPRGEYAAFLRSPQGRFLRVRMEDGVHYAPAGGKLIARWLVDWIYERRSMAAAR